MGIISGGVLEDSHDASNLRYPLHVGASEHEVAVHVDPLDKLGFSYLKA